MDNSAVIIRKRFGTEKGENVRSPISVEILEKGK